MNSRLRVLECTTSYPLTTSSVSGVFVGRLAEALAKKCLVSVVTPDDHFSPDESVACSDTLRLHRVRYAPKSWQKLAHQPGGIPVFLRTHPGYWILVPVLLLSFLWKIIKVSRHVDVIHANWAICGFIAGLGRWFHRKVVVTTLRGEDINQTSPISRYILTKSIAWSDGVVFVGEGLDGKISGMYNPEKAVVIHNGVADEFVRLGLSKKDKAVSSDVIELTTVGSLIPRKNVQLIFKALAMREKSLPKLKLNVIGEGKERQKLTQLAKDLSLADQIVFHGSCPPEDVAELLSRTTIFISASTGEGRPNAVVEAMASGCCVIASDIAPHTQLICPGQDGLVFESENERDLAKAIDGCLNDIENTLHMGQEACQKVKKLGMTWEGCADKYMKFFGRFVPSTGSKAG